jgi:hypothetical protein
VAQEVAEALTKERSISSSEMSTALHVLGLEIADDEASAEEMRRRHHAAAAAVARAASEEKKQAVASAETLGERLRQEVVDAIDRAEAVSAVVTSVLQGAIKEGEEAVCQALTDAERKHVAALADLEDRMQAEQLEAHETWTGEVREREAAVERRALEIQEWVHSSTGAMRRTLSRARAQAKRAAAPPASPQAARCRLQVAETSPHREVPGLMVPPRPPRDQPRDQARWEAVGIHEPQGQLGEALKDAFTSVGGHTTLSDEQASVWDPSIEDAEEGCLADGEREPTSHPHNEAVSFDQLSLSARYNWEAGWLARPTKHASHATTARAQDLSEMPKAPTLTAMIEEVRLSRGTPVRALDQDLDGVFKA